jgi:hypothetical protein
MTDAAVEWLAPAVGVGWAFGLQRSELGAAPVVDLVTVNVRVPLSARLGLELQADPVELWTSTVWTRQPRLGLTAWAEHAAPLTERWALLPGVGLDGAIGVATDLGADDALEHTPIGALGGLARVGVLRRGARGGGTTFALRGTFGAGFYDDGPWVRGGLEVQHLVRVGRP